MSSKPVKLPARECSPLHLCITWSQPFAPVHHLIFAQINVHLSIFMNIFSACPDYCKSCQLASLESGPLFCRPEIPFMIDYLFQPLLVLQWSNLSLLLFDTFCSHSKMSQTCLVFSSLSEQLITMVVSLKQSQEVRTAGFCLQSNHWAKAVKLLSYLHLQFACL